MVPWLRIRPPILRPTAGSVNNSFLNIVAKPSGSRKLRSGLFHSRAKPTAKKSLGKFNSSSSSSSMSKRNQSTPDKLTSLAMKPWSSPTGFPGPLVLVLRSTKLNPNWDNSNEAGSTFCKSSQRIVPKEARAAQRNKISVQVEPLHSQGSVLNSQRLQLYTDPPVALVVHLYSIQQFTTSLTPTIADLLKYELLMGLVQLVPAMLTSNVSTSVQFCPLVELHSALPGIAKNRHSGWPRCPSCNNQPVSHLLPGPSPIVQRLWTARTKCRHPCSIRIGQPHKCRNCRKFCLHYYLRQMKGPLLLWSLLLICSGSIASLCMLCQLSLQRSQTQHGATCNYAIVTVRYAVCMTGVLCKLAMWYTFLHALSTHELKPTTWSILPIQKCSCNCISPCSTVAITSASSTSPCASSSSWKAAETCTGELKTPRKAL